MVVVYFFAAFIFSVAVTFLAIRIANRHALHAIPNHRSSHSIPTPRIGGVGVAALPLLYLFFHIFNEMYHVSKTGGASITQADGDYLLPAQVQVLWSSALLLGGSLFFVLGFDDDLNSLPPKTKLDNQFAITFITLLALFIIQWYWDFPADLKYSLLMYPVAFVWIVGFVNGFNFMDGMNGKAGTFSLLALVFMLGVREMGRVEAENGIYNVHEFVADASRELGMFYTIVCGSIAGFLVFNLRKRALIFLGDSGSYFLGFLLAILAVLLSDSFFGPGASFLALLIVLMPFWYDVAFTLIKRFFEGKKIWEAHREHLYQRLMIQGMSHMQVLVVCLVTYAACGFLALICATSSTFAGRVFSLLGGFLVMGIYTGLVFHQERQTQAS